MPQRTLPQKEFVRENASLLNLMKFKSSDGITINTHTRPGYVATFVNGDVHGKYIRNISLPFPFTGITLAAIKMICGNVTNVEVTENIFFNQLTKEYKCYINDVNMGIYKDLFGIEEIFTVKELPMENGGTKLVGTFNVTIDNRLNILLAGSVERKYLAERYIRLEEELAAASTDGNTTVSKSYHEELDKYGQTDENGNLIVNENELKDFINNLDDDDIPQ